MSRYELTEFEWRVIEPLLPNKPRGMPRVNDRRVLSGISVRVHHSAATLKKATRIVVLEEAGEVLLQKSML